jgi:uncharacterized membrane protein YjfL (UPF0719 family)
MSGDEVFALIVCLVVGCVGWWSWLSGLFFMKPFVWRTGTKPHAVVWPLLSAACVLFVLCRWSSHDVRSDPVYIFFYFVMWFGWTGAVLKVMPYLGLSARDDLLERQNPAAGLAVGGALLGSTLTFSGGNIGDGPGWWVVVFSAGLANGALLLMWVFGNLFTHVEEVLTVERDVAAGWRTFGYFAGGGLILGRAVAGNWQSGTETIADFVAKGWPVVFVWGSAVVMDAVLRPSPSCPARPPGQCGLLPAAVLIGMGLLLAKAQGAW